MNAMIARTNFAAIPEGQRPYGGIANFYAEVGQVDRAKEFLARDIAEWTDSTERRIREPGFNAIRGIIARAEGRYDEALRLIRKADTTYDGPNGNCAICIYDDLAETFDRMGNADSAIYYYETYFATPYYGRHNMDAAQKAIRLRRLGELHEQQGNIPRAAEYYREFVSLWERADPSVQPQVAEVRRRLSRMGNVEASGGRR
jgi:tetratricopeptide (TPR) repeat protein